MHGRRVGCVAWHKVSPQGRDASSTIVSVSCDARADEVVGALVPQEAHWLGIWTSPAVQWLRICLPMKGTWAPSLVCEGSTLCGGNSAPQLLSPRT